MGVLGPGIRTDEYREREVRAIRRVIVQGRMGEGDFPNDPFAVDAALLGDRYLHQGYDSGNLKTLLAKERSHPAYREALTIIVGEMRRRNVDLPGPLRRRKQVHKRTKERWRSEKTRNYRIGFVVEAMAVGSNILIVCGENERTLRQLQVDLKAARDQLGGKSFKELCTGHDSERLQGTDRWHEIRNAYVVESPNDTEQVLKILNNMKARPWRHWNEGKGLTARDLVELTKLPLSEGAGVHAIRTDIEVRKHFSILHATRNDATSHNGSAYSICNAVAAVLKEAKQRGSSYRNVLKAWKAYRDTN